MKIGYSLKRAVVFYISVLIFFVTLPILLAYSLGYRINYRTMKVDKTGIIFINSKPSGADIYVNDKLCDNPTPAQIEDLNPGAYKVKVIREGFYPWHEELIVKPNMVTKADRIVLFPIIQDMKRLSAQPSSDFAVSDKGYIYYMAESGLYRSDNDGSNIKKLSSYSKWPKEIVRKRFSPDGDKFLCFNGKEVVVVYLTQDRAPVKYGEYARVDNVFIAEEPIVDVFWYTGSGYIIAVTEKYINVVELRGGARRNIAKLYKFNTPPRDVSYDPNNGSLYFMDKPEVSVPGDGKYLYRLDLRQKFFDSLMQLLLKKETEPLNDKR